MINNKLKYNYKPLKFKKMKTLKKTLNYSTKMLFVAICSMLFVALSTNSCGGKPEPLGGKYTLTSMESGGEKISGSDLKSLGMEFNFEFHDNGVCNASMFGLEAEGTYKLDGEKLTITIRNDDNEDKELSGTYANNKVTLMMDDAKMVFKKD